MSILRKFRKSVKNPTLRFDPVMYNNVLGSLVITHYVLRTLDGEETDVNKIKSTWKALSKKKDLGLNKDQWLSFYDLLKYLGKTKKFEDCYNMNEAWPVLFDDFYLYYCEIKKIKPRLPEQENDYSEY